MKILALMVVKNEDDIVKYAIEDALRWADYIAIMDNNSTDNTNDILQELSRKYDNVLFWGKYEGPFHDWLRALLYNDYKQLIDPGDWVCRLDADEFYIDDPKRVLSEVSAKIDIVYSVSFQYYYTDKDLEENEDQKPAHMRMKYYSANHSESRFCKIKKNTNWPITRSWPIGVDTVSEKKIRLKHFQYRSKLQMNKRFSSREEINNSSANKNLFMHEHSNNKVFDHTSLTYDNGEYSYSNAELPKPAHLNWFNRVLFHPLVATFFGIERIKQILYPPTNGRIK